MILESTTTASIPEILSRAKAFFAERVPHQAAFPEREGENYLLLRGQGGEEIAVAVRAGTIAGTWTVRASTLLFEQAVRRFLSTLPVPGIAV